jgi:hypothetical protein
LNYDFFGRSNVTQHGRHERRPKSERSYGASAADADKFAAEEIQMIVDSIVTSFNENIESGAKLTPEK